MKLRIAHTLTFGFWIHDRSWEDKSQGWWGVTVCTCIVAGWYAPAVWSLYGSKPISSWPAAGGYQICEFVLLDSSTPVFSVFDKSHYAGCLPNGISHASAHWRNHQTRVWKHWHYPWWKYVLQLNLLEHYLTISASGIYRCQTQDPEICTDWCPSQLETLCKWWWSKDLPNADDDPSCTVVSKGCWVERLPLSQGQ